MALIAATPANPTIIVVIRLIDASADGILSSSVTASINNFVRYNIARGRRPWMTRTAILQTARPGLLCHTNERAWRIVQRKGRMRFRMIFPDIKIDIPSEHHRPVMLASNGRIPPLACCSIRRIRIRHCVTLPMPAYLVKRQAIQCEPRMAIEM